MYAERVNLRDALVSTLATIAISAVFPTFAHADVVPPPGDCEKKSEGDACTDYDGKPGACGTITYTKSLPPLSPSSQPVTTTQSYFGCKTGAVPKHAGKSCNVHDVGEETDAGAGLVMLALGLIAFARRRS